MTRTQKLSNAARKAWATRRKNAVKTIVTTTKNPSVLTVAEARKLHKDINKLSPQAAIQMLHAFVDLVRGKNN